MDCRWCSSAAIFRSFLRFIIVSYRNQATTCGTKKKDSKGKPNKEDAQLPLDCHSMRVMIQVMRWWIVGGFKDLGIYCNAKNWIHQGPHPRRSRHCHGLFLRLSVAPPTYFIFALIVEGKRSRTTTTTHPQTHKTTSYESKETRALLPTQATRWLESLLTASATLRTHSQRGAATWRAVGTNVADRRAVFLFLVVLLWQRRRFAVVDT